MHLELTVNFPRKIVKSQERHLKFRLLILSTYEIAKSLKIKFLDTKSAIVKAELIFWCPFSRILDLDYKKFDFWKILCVFFVAFNENILENNLYSF